MGGGKGQGGKGKGAAGKTSPGKTAPVEMTSAGSSTSWEAQKARHENLGDEFLSWIASHDKDLSARWGLKWAEVPEEEACATEIFGYYATFLTEGHIIEKGRINAGQNFDLKSAEYAFNGSLQSVTRRFAKSKRSETQARAPFPFSSRYKSTPAPS